jgi:hypothetical protein
MANLANLKPFKKGHKKLGGRKKGVPNKSSHFVDKAFMTAVEQIGSDGRGKGGAVGYFSSFVRSLLRKNNQNAILSLVTALIRYEAKHPPRDLAMRGFLDLLQSQQLTKEEKNILLQIAHKVLG